MDCIRIAKKQMMDGSCSYAILKVSNDQIAQEVIEPSTSIDKDNNNNNDSFIFPKEHLLTLLERMEKSCSPYDSQKYQTILKKIDWDKIAFDNFTGEQCKTGWYQLQKNLRGHRLLSELIIDGKQLLNKTFASNRQNHPDFPKKPLTSCIMYYMNTIPAIQTENPGIKIHELAKILINKYNNLSDDVKDTYKQIAVLKFALYKQQVDDFYRSHPEINWFDCEKPIKPVGAFELFCVEKLKLVPDVDPGMFLAACQNLWEELDPNEKHLWTNKAIKLEREYYKNVYRYMKIRNFPKPATSPYFHFRDLELKSDKYKNVERPRRIVYSAWTKMTTDQKQIYIDDLNRIQSFFWNAYENLPDGFSDAQENTTELRQLNLMLLNQAVPKNFLEMSEMEKFSFANLLQTATKWFKLQQQSISVPNETNCNV